jgi:hypothetical protein
MADPQIAARYVLDRCTPPEIRRELEKRFGARDGDVVVMFDDGSIGLARIEEGPEATRLGRLIWPAPEASSPSASSPLPRRHRRGHLKVEK